MRKTSRSFQPILFTVFLLVISLAFLCAQGCSESRQRIKNETAQKKERTEQILINQKIRLQNELNEKIYLASYKFGVEPNASKAILSEYLLETRDFDFYDLDPEFFMKTLTSDPKSIDYQSVIERICYQHDISKQTVAGLILEFKTLSRLKDISENLETGRE
ncbi:MAG: hypothetical protein ACLP3B_05205 [Syntrophobacteraceae bacterium]